MTYDYGPPRPVPEPGPRVPPRWLDAEGRRVWRDLRARLDAMAVLGLVDYYALAVFCDTWSRWRRARDFVEKHGDSYLVRDRAGNVKGVRLYPQVRQADRLAEQLMRMARELGITPGSRSRASVIPQDWYPQWNEILRKKPEDVRAQILDPSLDPEEDTGDDDSDDDSGGDDPGPGAGAPESEGPGPAASPA